MTPENSQKHWKIIQEAGDYLSVDLLNTKD